MPNAIAYVRISDSHKQDNTTQKQRIAEYAVKNGVMINQWIEREQSGSKTNRSQRGLDTILANLAPGDQLLISDIARLGRTSISDIVEIVTRIINAGATLHICYSDTSLTPADTNDLAKIFLTLGEAYAAVKFAQERSYKAKAAIRSRQQRGLANGRPRGAIVRSKLDDHEHTILSLTAGQWSEYKIAEYLGIERSTLRTWKKKRQELIDKAKAAGLWQPHLKLSEIKALLKQK